LSESTDPVTSRIKSDTRGRRFEFRIISREDLLVRVIRAETCQIEIPELGVVIEPGNASEGFITNVEGVLLRIEKVLGMTKNWAIRDGDKDKIEQIEELSNRIDAVKNGEFAITLILEDETGNSAILGE